jgi:Uri superfamily endonuclease
VQKIIKNNSGVYLLELKVLAPFLISSRKFFQHKFEKGFYYYSGSAQKNLWQRICRHIKYEKIVHWHIDHLTTHISVEIKNIFVAEGSDKNLECEFIDTLSNEFSLEIAVYGFGNSDCDKCLSHLLYSKNKINHNHFLSRYQSIVCLIPSSSFTCCE